MLKMWKIMDKYVLILSVILRYIYKFVIKVFVFWKKKIIKKIELIIV